MPLPKGYVLDKPSGLPKGYVLDDAAAPKAATKDFTKGGGVKVVGRNAAGQPIYGPEGTAPKGSAGWRFLSSAGEQLVAPVTGVYHALTQGPQTPTEARIEAIDPLMGRVAVRANRMLVAPQIDQARQAWQEGKQANWLSLKPEDVRRQALALGHGLAAVTPLVGPAAATISQQAGKQAGAGDWAGAAGTVGGAAALEAVPKLGVKVGKVITETLPKHAITRIIRPMTKDVQFDKEPAQAILDEGIVSWSLDGIAKKVAQKMKTVGADIDRMAADPKYAKTKVNLTTAIDPLRKATNEAIMAGDTALYNKLSNLENELGYEYVERKIPGKPATPAQPAVPGKPATRAKYGTGGKPGTPAQPAVPGRPARPAQPATPDQFVLERAGPRKTIVSPTEALKLKRMIGKRIRWSEDALDEEVNGALGAVYGRVNDLLNSAVPELETLNNRYANLVSSAKAIERRVPVEARQAYVGLFDLVLGASGHLPLLLAKKATELTGVKTAVAQGAHQVGKVLPKKAPLKTSVPAVAVAQNQQHRQRPKSLRELQAEARRRRPAGSTAPVGQYDVQTGAIGTDAPQ